MEEYKVIRIIEDSNGRTTTVPKRGNKVDCQMYVRDAYYNKKWRIGINNNFRFDDENLEYAGIETSSYKIYWKVVKE